MLQDRPGEHPGGHPTRRRLGARLLASRVAAGLPLALALVLAAPAPSRAGVPATPAPAATTVAWFCSDPPAAPCPPQVQYQIIDGVVYDNGSVIGRYVDDQVPTQQATVTQDLAQGIGMVLAGIAQGDAGRTVAGAISSLEWYPFPSYGLVPVPPAGYSSYILQAGFSWGTRAPTAGEIQLSYCGTLALHPRLIVFYYWTPVSWAAVNSARCGALGVLRAPAGDHRRHHRTERRGQEQRERVAKSARARARKNRMEKSADQAAPRLGG